MLLLLLQLIILLYLSSNSDLHFVSLSLCSPGGFHDSSSSSGIMDYSPLSSPRDSMVSSPITIKRGKNGYGLTFKSVRVYIGDSNDYRIHHIIDVSITQTCE